MPLQGIAAPHSSSSMQAFSNALPIPSPQYSLATLMPNSARCRTLYFAPTASIPAVPAITPSTSAMISASFPLSDFFLKSAPSSEASKLFSSG